MSELSKSAKRVQDAIESRGFSFQVAELPGSTRTAQEAADTIGCELGQIAKSLVFMDVETGEPILIIASGKNRVDLAKVRETTGLRLKQATADFVRDRIGFAIGGIPPVAHDEPVRTFLDEGLQEYETVWAAAGTPFAVFQFPVSNLAALTSGEWISIKP